ncbi:hypothetical protein GGF46_004266 [Coemansia sp. RSA 552]|nr:hypothetical protein GGF46_004266 [Coemansia sp. RSA 552]
MDRPEERREFLYSNLAKQLDRLNRNFESLSTNLQRLRDQTEQSQRLSMLQASMFMGAKNVFDK